MNGGPISAGGGGSANRRWLGSLSILRATVSDPLQFFSSFTAQLERERHSFLWRNAIYVAANIVLAGLVWNRSGAGAAAWVPAALAFLLNIYHLLTMEWEQRGEAVWRRELPRLQSRLGGPGQLEDVLADPAQGRLRRWMKWTAWAVTAAWLGVLLLVIRATGFDFRLAS